MSHGHSHGGQPCHGHGNPNDQFHHIPAYSHDVHSDHGHSHEGHPSQIYEDLDDDYYSPPPQHGHSHGGQPCHGHGHGHSHDHEDEELYQTQFHLMPNKFLDKAKFNVDSQFEIDGIRYVEYKDETQMPLIMNLITKDLSEPYSIYTYRYFIHNWPYLCFLVS